MLQMKCLVNNFLEKKISWNDISTTLETLMERHQLHSVTSINDVLLIDAQARQEAINLLR